TPTVWSALTSHLRISLSTASAFSRANRVGAHSSDPSLVHGLKSSAVFRTPQWCRACRSAPALYHLQRAKAHRQKVRLTLFLSIVTAKRLTRNQSVSGKLGRYPPRGLAGGPCLSTRR